MFVDGTRNMHLSIPKRQDEVEKNVFWLVFETEKANYHSYDKKIINALENNCSLRLANNTYFRGAYSLLRSCRHIDLESLRNN